MPRPRRLESELEAVGAIATQYLPSSEFIALLNKLREAHVTEVRRAEGKHLSTNSYPSTAAQERSFLSPEQSRSGFLTATTGSPAAIGTAEQAGILAAPTTEANGDSLPLPPEQQGDRAPAQATATIGSDTAHTSSSRWGRASVAATVEHAANSTGLTRQMEKHDGLIKAAIANVGGTTIDHTTDIFEHQNKANAKWTFKIVSHPSFEVVSGVLIWLNACSLMVEAQYNSFDIGCKLGVPGWGACSEEKWPGAHGALIAIGWVFGIVFWIEYLLRLEVGRMRFICDPWGLLDGMIVVSWTIDAGGASLPVNPQIIRLVRLFRLLRLLKLVRAVQGFDSLHVITTAIHGSLVSLAWAIVVFVVALATFALVVNQIVNDVYFETLYDKVEGDAELLFSAKNSGTSPLQVFLYFGSFTRSLFSMFEVTLGNWPPIGRILSEQVSEVFMLVSVIQKLTVGFALVGVINGIFMQETFKVVNQDDIIMMRQKERVKKNHEHKMHELFVHADKSRDGGIGIDEFEEIVENPHIKAWLGSMDFDIRDSKAVFKLLAGSGAEIDVTGLVSGVAQLKGPARSMDLMLLSQLTERLQGQVHAMSEALGVYLTDDAVGSPYFAKD